LNNTLSEIGYVCTIVWKNTVESEG